MDKWEQKLIDRIRESEDPEEAMRIAKEVLLQRVNQMPLSRNLASTSS
jgi:hypothetical protein